MFLLGSFAIAAFWFFDFETDPFLWFAFVFHQLSYGLEDNPELLVIVFLKLIQLSCQVSVRSQHTAQFNKCPHYFNIDPDRTSAF